MTKMTVQENLDNQYKKILNYIKYNEEFMMRPYEGDHQHLHNLKGNKDHHELHMKKFEIEIKMYEYKHKLGMWKPSKRIKK